MTRIIKVQIEATPAIIQEELQKWFAKNEQAFAAVQFPYAKGEFVRLNEGVANAMGCDPNSPAMVVTDPGANGTSLVAFFNGAGEIATHIFAVNDVRPLNDPAPPAMPQSDADVSPAAEYPDHSGED